MDSFSARLDGVIASKKTMVCVGLDPVPSRMPTPDVLAFNKRIIDATHPMVAAYKPQLAFYEALGIEGMKALEGTIEHIRDVAPEVVIIGDGKRGDIGSTAAAYASAMFDHWDFDATTVNAYQGSDSVEPFMQYPGRGIFVLCRTSNPSSRDFQDLRSDEEHKPQFFQKVADAAERWNTNGNIGLVVGATAPMELRLIRADHQSMPFLVPGVGAQGGDAVQAVKAGCDGNGRGMLISSSRAILYASDDPRDFARYARIACHTLQRQIEQATEYVPGGSV